jgi:hypothetical protein
MRASGILLLGIAAVILSTSLLVKSITTKNAHTFEIKNTGNGRWDRFLIDRKTGRIWTMFCDGKSNGQDCDGMIYWWEMYVNGITPPDTTSAKYFHQRHPNMQ